MVEKSRSLGSRRLVVALMALAVLLPSLYGFGTKFIEFVALYRGDVDGVFAITPILNYLLASLGFLCLFGWAALGGMFHDVEKPKQAMLANEAMLDRAAPWRLALNRSTAPAPAHRSGEVRANHRLRSFYEHE